MVHETVVEVLTTQMGVAGSRLDLEDALLDSEERNIEGTATEVEDENVALALNLLVETVGDGSSRGLVDDAKDVETGNETGVLGGLALRVVEVGGDSDDGIVDGATKVGLGNLAHLGEDHRGDLLGSEGFDLALELDLDDGLAAAVDDLEGEVLHVGLNLSVGKLAADEALGVEDCVDGVHGDLVLGGISDETLRVREGHERGCCAVALVIGNDFTSGGESVFVRDGVAKAEEGGRGGGNVPVLAEHTHARVGGAQVDTDSGSHSEDCSRRSLGSVVWKKRWCSAVKSGCLGGRGV